MLKIIKKILYKILPQWMFLRLMHRGFYFLYRLGLLKNNASFKYHYLVRKIIRPDDTVVDIGANLGYFAKTFSDLTPKGKLVCIEPIPPFYDVLNHFLGARKNTVIYNTALGTEPGELTMVLPKTKGVMRTGLPHVPREGEDISEMDKIQVKVSKGSDLLRQLDNIDYIKCDIEGYEWVVFQEIERVIHDKRPIVQVELAESNEELMKAYFQKMNYVQFGIANFKFVMESGKQQEQGDFLFVPEEKTHLII